MAPCITAGRLNLTHRSTIAGTLLRMFGSLTLNGFVFLSIFNGVSNLMLNKVMGM